MSTPAKRNLLAAFDMAAAAAGGECATIEKSRVWVDARDLSPPPRPVKPPRRRMRENLKPSKKSRH